MIIVVRENNVNGENLFDQYFSDLTATEVIQTDKGDVIIVVEYK